MLARWGLFVVWCLVLWGTLWDAALLWTLVSDGFSAAAGAAFKHPADQAGAAWGNRICGLLAFFAWVVVLFGRWSSPRRAA